MDPSLGSARFESVLTRVFDEKAQLGWLTVPKNSVYGKKPKMSRPRVIYPGYQDPRLKYLLHNYLK